MGPGYQGRIDDDDEGLRHRHDALSGDDFNAGIESENPEEDRRMKKEIMARLKSHPSLDVSEVKLNVKGGFASITGTIANADMKSTVEALVTQFDGVIDVVNFLQLRKNIH